MRAPSQRRSIVPWLIAATLFAVLGGCGGGAAPAERDGFEPITCSASPSPCA